MKCPDKIRIKKIVMNKFVTTILIIFIFSGISYLSGQTSKYEGKIVKKISFTGVTNTDEKDLLFEMKTTVGHPLKYLEMKEDIKKVYKKGKFKSLSVDIEEYKGGVRLRFNCEELPMVKELIFKGIDEFSDTDLSEAIVIKAGSAYRKDLVEKSIEIMKKKYHEEGLFNAVIKYKITKIKKTNHVNVTFIIDEGEEITVEKITILGARKIYHKDLQGLMDTKEKWLMSDGTFKQDVYNKDKSKIIGFYKQSGYLDARIIEDKVTYEWLNPLKKEKRVIYIVIKIFEGDKYYFDKYTLKIIPNKGKKPVFKKDFFFKNFKLNKRGQIFNNTMFLQDRQLISMSYGNRGYIFTRIVPRRTISIQNVKVKKGKTFVMEKRKYVKIAISVTEGAQAYIDQIIIKGNKRTQDKVIRRELLIKPGELFSSGKMQISRQKVFNLGFFKEVNFEVRPGSREGYMNVIIDVVEQHSGTISMGGGYGTTSGFSIFADIAENNVMGTGQRVGIKFEYGPLRYSTKVTYANRWMFDIPLGFNAQIFNYQYQYTTGSIFPNTAVQATYDVMSIGYSLGVSYRFLTFVTTGISWTHSWKWYMNPSGNCPSEIYEHVASQDNPKTTIQPYIFFDNKNNYLNPSKGIRAGFTIGFTGGIPGLSKDHFIKYKPEFEGYFSFFHLPFLKTHPVVFQFRLNGSFTGMPMTSAWLDSSQPATTNEWVEYEDRLTVGGPETVRMYDYLDPTLPSSWTTVGLYHRIQFGIEMRFPIHPQMLWMAFFFDAGAVWSDYNWESRMSTTNLTTLQGDIAAGNVMRIQDFFSDFGKTMGYFKYSFGFGFRIQIPMMPLRFWWGWKLQFENGQPIVDMTDIRFQFQIGDYRF